MGRLFLDKITKYLEIKREEADESFSKHYYEYMELGKESEDVFWKELISKSKKDVSADTVKKLYYDLIYINKDVMGIVKKLSKRYDLYTLNNEGREWMDVRIRKFGLKRYFKDFVCSSYFGCAKPDKRIYEIFLNTVKQKPDECLFIDDKERNLVPAAELGMKTILFRNAKQLKSDLKRFEIVA